MKNGTEDKNRKKCSPFGFIMIDSVRKPTTEAWDC